MDSSTYTPLQFTVDGKHCSVTEEGESHSRDSICTLKQMEHKGTQGLGNVKVIPQHVVCSYSQKIV